MLNIENNIYSAPVVYNNNNLNIIHKEKLNENSKEYSSDSYNSGSEKEEKPINIKNLLNNIHPLVKKDNNNSKNYTSKDDIKSNNIKKNKIQLTNNNQTIHRDDNNYKTNKKFSVTAKNNFLPLSKNVNNEIDKRIAEKFYNPFIEKKSYNTKLNQNIGEIKKMTRSSALMNLYLTKKKKEIDNVADELIIYNNPSKISLILHL